MLRISSVNEHGENVFRFKSTPVSEVIEVTWSGEIGAFPKDIARGLIAGKYARNLTEDEFNGLSSDVENEDDDADADADAESDADDDVNNPQPKRRGRPPKAVVDTSEEIGDNTIVATTKENDDG